jgi:predicted RNA-binding protein
LKKIKEIPCSCKACEGKSSKDLIGDFDSILLHNFNVNLNAVREIRESIRSGEFRELVEEKAACDVNFALMLRLLDKEKQDFLERYTPI